MKILICLLLFILLYLFMVHPRLLRPDNTRFHNVCFAHRGLHDTEKKIPENSPAAFARAVEAGYGIELDVQLSADGIPVVFHDSTLGRMCGIDRRVDSFSCKELQSLFLSQTAEHIPTFAEVLSLVGGRVPLLVEIKMDHVDFSIPRKIDALLADYPGPYCIESFHPAALLWYRRHRPDVYRGQLSTHFNVENRTLSPFQWLLGKMVLNFAGRPDFISYNWHFRKDVSLSICRKLFGADAAGWVIRTPKELETCRKRFGMFIFEGFLPDKNNG